MEISSCCGVCSLRTGTIIIGILNLIFGVLTLIIGSIFFYAALPPHYSIESKSIGGGIISYILIVLVLGLLLIVGAVKRNVNFVFPSVYLNFGHILTYIGGCISIIIVCCMTEIPGILIFVILFSTGVGLSLHIYFWLIIYFFYKSLNAEQRELDINPNNYHESHRSPLISA